MQDILELVHVSGREELWRPATPTGNLMQISTPQVGDFMVEHPTGVQYLRPEPMSIKVKDVKGYQLQIDLEGDMVPNWFHELMHTRQINSNGGKMVLNDQEIKPGVNIVFDGQTARVEESDDRTELPTH